MSAMSEGMDRIGSIGLLGRDEADPSDVAWLEGVAAAEPKGTDDKWLGLAARTLLQQWAAPPPPPPDPAADAQSPPAEDAYTQGLPPKGPAAFSAAVVERATLRHNPTSEAYLLAALVQIPAARAELLGLVEPDDFHVDWHRLAFDRIAALDAAGPFDFGLLINAFGAHDEWRSLSGGDRLAALAGLIVREDLARQHAGVVRDLGVTRRIVRGFRATLWGLAEGKVSPAKAVESLAGIAVGPDADPSGSAAGWPSPPGEAVWHGPVGDLVRTIEPHTEADPVAVLAQLLVIFGNLIGRTAHWAVGGRRHFCNLNLAVVGPTSVARKGTAFDAADQLVGGLDEDWRENFPLRGLVSGEGFINAVKDPDVTDKRALWMEAEFGAVAGVIARDGNNLSGKIREAFDSGDIASASKVDPVRATGAHISIIGHTTFQELRENLGAREYSNGFVNRFMWVCSRMSKVLANGGDLGLLNLAGPKRAFEQAFNFARSRSVAGQAMPLDTESQALWAALYPHLLRPRPGRMSQVTARSYVIVRRVAVLYAVLDRSRQVRRPHLEAASELWSYCDRSARFIFAEGDCDAVSQKVFDQIAEAGKGGATRNDLGRKAFNGRNLDKLGRVLDDLVRQGLIVSEVQKRPRPTEVWRVIG